MFVKHFQMAVFSLCPEFLRRERFFLGLIEYTHIGSCVKKKKTCNSVDLGVAKGNKVLTGVLNLKHNSVTFFH